MPIAKRAGRHETLIVLISGWKQVLEHSKVSSSNKCLITHTRDDAHPEMGF
jgi:hypothetical protein